LIFDKFNRLIDFNSAAVLIFKSLTYKDIGSRAEELLQNNPELLQYFTANVFDEYEYELLIDHAWGYCYYNCRISPIFSAEQKPWGNILVFNDVTQQRVLIEQLHKMASIDSLTMAFNRKYFREYSNTYITDAQNFGQVISVIMMDIDNFKDINDNFGHHAGDVVLQTITDICKRNLRPSEIFGRYGGEEFVAFLPDTTAEMAYKAADRLRILITENRTLVECHVITTTASFGVVSTDELEDTNIDALLRLADQALYKAKDAGRNCVMIA